MIDGLSIRRATEADVGIIVASWQQGCYGSEFWGDKAVRLGDFKRGHRRVIARCLLDACIVACDEIDPRVVIGWACGAPGVLHYVYVKRKFRGDGIARALLDAIGAGEGPLTVTHMTGAIRRWNRPVEFNPYLVIG